MVCGQTLPPKAKPADYPAHTAAGTIEIGADYLVQSVPTERGIILAPDYLIVEIGIFTERKAPFEVRSGHFSLRVNGEKGLRTPDAPGAVVAALKYATAGLNRPQITAGAGAGDVGVVLGQPAPTPRFPGDPTGGPRPRPQAPENAGIRRQDDQFFEEAITQEALPEGDLRLPVAGLLYFPCTLKPRKIKSIELVYEGPAGRASLFLLRR